MSPNGLDRGIDDGLKPPSCRLRERHISSALGVAACAYGTGKDYNVNAKILAALEGLQERLGILEVSQIKRDEEERMQGAIETGVFGIALGRSFNASRPRMNALITRCRGVDRSTKVRCSCSLDNLSTT